MAADTSSPKPKRPIKVPNAGAIAMRKRIFKWGGLGLLAVIIVGGGFGLWKWQSLYSGMPSLPEVEELWAANREAAIEFVDMEGNTLDVRGPRYGRATDVSLLPPHVPQAFIAAEDKRFYEHDGADEAAIARAVWSNTRAGETVSGASTLTQQVIKNLVLDSSQTMKRKAQEMKLARKLETKMEKDEILTLYLNRMYFGAGLYGIDAASSYYFGKPPEEMTIAEAAIMAALMKAPSKLNLRENLVGAQERSVYVLTEMLDLAFITQEQFDAAKAEEIKIIDAPIYEDQLGYALDAAAERVKGMLPTVPGDLVVTVTIDPEIQGKIRAQLDKRMKLDGEPQGATQVAALVFDKTGRTVAMIGGRDYKASEFNRVTQAKRQPGSSFKPFVYAAALEDGFSPYDVFTDAPLQIGKWKPENYGGGYLGPMTLSEAITRSTNTIAAELAQETSEERVVSLAQKFGINSEMKPFPSLALGSQEVTLWEITRAYGAFQSGGLRMDPSLIERIEDSRGNILYERPEYTRDRVLDQELAEDMNAMMVRVVNAEIGTGGRARIPNWTVAGKTGTSQEWRDAWFVGFTGAHVGAVWVGNDDDSPMKRVSGGGLPSDLWSDMMVIAHEGKTPESLIGGEGGAVISEAAEARIAFYRGMSQAFASAAGDRSDSRRSGAQ